MSGNPNTDTAEDSTVAAEDVVNDKGEAAPLGDEQPAPPIAPILVAAGIL